MARPTGRAKYNRFDCADFGLGILLAPFGHT
jgi:hypothetical protein